MVNARYFGARLGLCTQPRALRALGRAPKYHALTIKWLLMKVVFNICLLFLAYYVN